MEEHGRADWIRLSLLVVLAGAIHLWLFSHTEVAARDSIGYIRYAYHLETRPLLETLRGFEQHPGYPLAIYGMSLIVRQVVPGPEAVMMQTSAQLVSLIAGVLLVVPMY